MSNQKLNILEDDTKKIQYVAHMADIHIHKREREDEYRKVFNTLYEDLKKCKLNNKNSVIVVCGDVVHDKIDLHPVSVRLVMDFFISLCEITTVIVISGNHDVSPYNDDHNSLYSIVKNLKTKNNLFMLLDEGLYQYNNIVFGYTKFNNHLKVIRCTTNYKNMYKCALYHGTINNAVSDNGYIMKNDENAPKKYFSANDFSDYDFVFLGDIHRHSFLKDHIAYPGSLIQQSIEESLEKGYILWNLDKEKGDYRVIPNEKGKLKIKIDEDGKCDIDISKLPKYIDVNVECKSTNRKDIDNVYDKISIHDITVGKRHDTMIVKSAKFDTTINVNGKEKDLLLLKTKEDVVKLLLDCINSDRKNKISGNKLVSIKKKINDMLGENKFTDFTKKKEIKIISLKFDNMAIYGKNNFINFKNFKKIVGISSENSSGKSSLIDALLQSIFGECTRGIRSDMININAKSYSSEVILGVNGVTYIIKRICNRNSKLKTINKSNEILTLYENDENITGGTTTDTKKIIEEKIGSIEDFLMSCIVTQKTFYQGKFFGFAELTSKQKRDLLCKIARLDIFDCLYNLSSTRFKSISQHMAKYKKDFEMYDKFGNNVDEIKNNMNKKIKDFTKEIIANEKCVDQVKNKKNKIQRDIGNLRSSLAIINHEIQKYEKLDIAEKEFFDEDMKNMSEKYDEIINDLNKTNIDIDVLNDEIIELGDVDKIKEMFEDKKNKMLTELKNTLKNIRSRIWNGNYDYALYDPAKQESMKQNISNNILNICDKINALEVQKEQYIKNIGVKIFKKDHDLIDNFDKKKIELEKNNVELEKIKDELKNYRNKFVEVKNHEYDPNCKYCIKNSVTKEKIFLQNKINECVKEIDQLEKKNIVLVNYIEKNEERVNQINEIHENKRIAELKIEIIDKDIDICKHKEQKLKDDLEKINDVIDNYLKYEMNEEVNESIDELEKDIDEVKNDECQEYNEYNGLINQLREKKTKQKTLKLEMENIKKDMEKLKEKQKIYDKYSLEIQKYEKNIIDKNINENKINDANDLVDDLDKLINKCEKEIKRDQKELIEINQMGKSFENLYKNIKEMENDKDDYDMLNKILKNNVIVDSVMTKNLLPQFEKIVNEILNGFGSRGIRVEYIGSEIVIRDEYNVSTIRDGGYQTFLNNLVYRIALSKLNGYMCTNFMIIDEAFDSADNNSKTTIKNLIDYIRNINDWILIISHDDDIKDKFEQTLLIQNINTKEKRIEFK